MTWKKFVLYPVGIYAVIFLFISALIGAKVDQHTTWVWLVTLVISIIGLYLATDYAKPKNWKEGITYGLVWLLILFILDIVLTVPFTGWEYYNDWKVYIPYILTLLFPVVFVKK